MPSVSIHHVAGGTEGFFADSQQYYLKWGLSTDPDFQLYTDPPSVFPEIDHQREFISVKRHRFDAAVLFTSKSLVGMLQTDSLIRGLDETSRRCFLSDMGHLRDSGYGGEVSKNYLYEVVTARRRAK